MTKVSITNRHDSMRFVMKFPDVKISGNFNYYDHTIKVEPFNGPLIREVSGAIDYVMKASVNGKGGINPGQLFEVIEAAGTRANTAAEFVEFFKSDIEKAHGIVVRPFEATPVENSTASVKKDGRGWKLEAKFQNGDVLQLKSSGRSVEIGMQPPITGFMDAVTTLTFGYIGIGADPQQLLEAFCEHAKTATSTEDWIDSCRAGIVPGAVMKR